MLAVLFHIIKTRLFVPLTRNFDTTGDLQAVYDFNAQIFAEDQDMVESQKPEELPAGHQYGGTF